MGDEELNRPQRVYKTVTDNRVSIGFRESVDELDRAYPQVFAFPTAPSLTPEERERRRMRFDRLVSLLQLFDSEFDGAPYTYTELLSEALTRLEKERERIAANVK